MERLQRGGLFSCLDVKRRFQISVEHAEKRVALVRIVFEAFQNHLFRRRRHVRIVLARRHKAGAVDLLRQNFARRVASQWLVICGQLIRADAERFISFADAMASLPTR